MRFGKKKSEANPPKYPGLPYADAAAAGHPSL